MMLFACNPHEELYTGILHDTLSIIKDIVTCA
jgi:hypothetical protein